MEVLMGLSDAGLQFLVAASRANVGVKSGRPLGSNEMHSVYIYVVNEATSRMDDSDDSMKHQ